MALSHLPLAKRKNLVKIFGDLKKNYKSLQKISHTNVTNGFYLMRRIVEYPLKHSNFNQSFKASLTYSNLFSGRTKITVPLKIKGNLCPLITKVSGASEVANRTYKKRKIKYSQFFIKKPTNRNLLRLASLNVQASTITSPLFFSMTPFLISWVCETNTICTPLSPLLAFTYEAEGLVNSSPSASFTIKDGKKFASPTAPQALRDWLAELWDWKRCEDFVVAKKMVSKAEQAFHTLEQGKAERRNSNRLAFPLRVNTTYPPNSNRLSRGYNNGSTQILTNRKIFTYFNYAIYLYWSVGHGQNENLRLLQNCLTDFLGDSRFVGGTHTFRRTSVPQLRLPSSLFSTVRGFPVPQLRLPSKMVRSFPVPQLRKPFGTGLRNCGTGKGANQRRWSAELRDWKRCESKEMVRIASHPCTDKLCYDQVFAPLGRSWYARQNQKHEESVFRKLRIPFLSESDQVTFVAGFKITPNLSQARKPVPPHYVPSTYLQALLRPSLRTVRSFSVPFPFGTGKLLTIFDGKRSCGTSKTSFRHTAIRNLLDEVSGGKLRGLMDTKSSNLVDKSTRPKVIAQTFHVFPGQLLSYGDNIANNIVTTESGQVLYVDSQKTTLRKAQTVLIYSQAIIAVLSGEWVKKGTPLMSLSYQKLVTGDIVQGLPKIEQFFEAPVLKDGTFWSDSLQAKLNQFFQEQREQLPLAEAVRKGFSEIQRVLVEGVQRVYISQGVLIADKHLEVIVRQMTCKGRILYSGDTGFLRNELVSLDKIENVNQVTYGQKALYHPQVRGITDASLESESFLSAASFQETTRVLSRDAIIGKTDLMRGLKERVIVGELIQAGTGLASNNVYNLL